MFTATRVQVATYLLGVCPFSIAFLVFLNSSVSFVITDLIGRGTGVGNDVGNLGFADELLALVACPLWGLLSDRIGVRSVCVIGYMIIALSLVLFVQASNVYPQLLLGRLLFSLGAAAASTMVTAVLPAMSFAREPGLVTRSLTDDRFENGSGGNAHAQAPSVASGLTISQARHHPHAANGHTVRPSADAPNERTVSTSRVAGFVGMFTGFGALLALGLFLPLPARFQKIGYLPGPALQSSYYIVAGLAFGLSIVCFFGLRSLESEISKGWSKLFAKKQDSENSEDPGSYMLPPWSSLYRALLAGFQRSEIGLGYLGGFVARASSVGISLFIPLLVNALFLSSGLCSPEMSDRPAGLPDIKRQCPRAYVVAAELTGVSQLIALLFAPVFGYLSSRYRNMPLTVASAAGIIGYPLFANQFSPDDTDKGRRAVAFLAVCLIGLSQIGAIVCSLGSLGTGVLRADAASDKKESDRAESAGSVDDVRQDGATEHTRLIGGAASTRSSTLADLKGSIAGVYSFYGGAAILLLTKLGGSLFDKVSTGSPFYIMAAFNMILFLACISTQLRKLFRATSASSTM